MNRMKQREEEEEREEKKKNKTQRKIQFICGGNLENEFITQHHYWFQVEEKGWNREKKERNLPSNRHVAERRVMFIHASDD